jgi:hypothetical protein
VIHLKEVQTKEDLMEQLSNMNKENNVCQVFIPGKGKFTIVLQEEDYQWVNDSMEAENERRAVSASELVRNPFQ